MKLNLLDRPLIPLADPDDASVTYEKIRPYLLETDIVPLVVHLIEKAGGAPDKASAEQRKEYAEKTFKQFRDRAETDDIEVDTNILYETNVGEGIKTAAEEHDASAIVFRSRGGGRWIDLVTGRVRSNLLQNNDQPVVVLPEREVES